MPIPQYTLQQLNELCQDIYMLSEERFHYYFTHLYGWTKTQCRDGFDIIHRFPYRLRSEEDYAAIEELLPKALEVMNIITMPDHRLIYFNGNNEESRKVMVIYEEDEVLKEIPVDFCRAEDVMVYAELLKRGINVRTILDFHEKIKADKSDSKQIEVYECDIFFTRKGGEYAFEKVRTQYIICMGGIYYKLLYTDGKGYVREGKPDIDKENQYNSGAIIFEDEWEKVGNAYTDLSFLIDKGLKTKDK